MRPAILVVSLFAFWLALSGHYTPAFIGLGFVCAVLSVLVSRRVRALDPEGQPIHLLRGAATYWPWLIMEILKSAVGVARIILDPRLPISPTMTVLKAGQKTEGARVTYANSITMTPGTLTVALQDDRLLVHALSRPGADELEAGGMDRRVVRFEGGG